MSCHQHVYPLPSPTTPLNRQLLSVGFHNYILYRHRAVVCEF